MIPVLEDISSQCILLRKLRDVPANIPAADHPGLSPVFLHKIHLDFNPTTVKLFVILTWTNFGVASNK